MPRARSRVARYTSREGSSAAIELPIGSSKHNTWLHRLFSNSAAAGASLEFADLVAGLLEKNPARRIGWATLRTHPCAPCCPAHSCSYAIAGSGTVFSLDRTVRDAVRVAAVTWTRASPSLHPWTFEQTVMQWLSPRPMLARLHQRPEISRLISCCIAAEVHGDSGTAKVTGPSWCCHTYQ